MLSEIFNIFIDGLHVCSDDGSTFASDFVAKHRCRPTVESEYRFTQHACLGARFFLRDAADLCSLGSLQKWEDPMTASLTLRSISLAALLGCTTLSAQPPRQPPTPVLLKRLAEALDGNRTGDPVFIVASYDSLSPVRGVFPTRADANALAHRLGTSYDVFGPFVAANEPRMLKVCKHDGTYSYAEPICPEPPDVLLANVAEISLHIVTTDGHTRDIPVGRTTDALFLSLPAVDKFMIPYYARVIGVDAAAALRASIARSMLPH